MLGARNYWDYLLRGPGGPAGEGAGRGGARGVLQLRPGRGRASHPLCLDADDARAGPRRPRTRLHRGAAGCARRPGRLRQRRTRGRAGGNGRRTPRRPRAGCCTPASGPSTRPRSRWPGCGTRSPCSASNAATATSQRWSPRGSAAWSRTCCSPSTGGCEPEEFGRIHHLPKPLLAEVRRGLQDRGLVTEAATFTNEGRAIKDRVEALTDALAAPAYDVLSANEVEELDHPPRAARRGGHGRSPLGRGSSAWRSAPARW